MTNQQIIERLMESDLSNIQNLRLLYDMGQNTQDLNVIRYVLDTAIGLAYKTVPGAYPLVREVMFCLAPYDFDCYLQALEWNRPAQSRFYMPRRTQLLPIVRGLQDMADGKLDELFISQPPRTGKSTLMLFYMTWMMGKNPELANLYCSYSDTLTEAFYNGVTEVITDPHTYAWHEVFQHAQIARTNTADEYIDINRKKRYHSLTCRSLYGTLNGACDATGLLVSDDLLSGIEEALNKDRLVSVWGKVDNNMLSRAKIDQGCKIIWCGTRWSIGDPIGVRIATLEESSQFNNWRWRVINIPALNDRDESNFDYQYGVGFSTETYHQRRASFERNDDIASWSAQYMGEPIEREGTVFMPGSMRYFNGVLPDEEPVRVFMAVDSAWGGGDYCAGPVCVKYANGDLYVVDVLYSNQEKTITQPEIIRLIKKWGIQAVQIEASRMTEGFAEDVERLLKDAGLRINLTTKPTMQSTAKGQRIFDKAPDIRARMLFLDQKHRHKAYNAFMTNVFSFKILGRNRHDDAPDSLCQTIEMDETTSFRTKLVKRLW